MIHKYLYIHIQIYIFIYRYLYNHTYILARLILAITFFHIISWKTIILPIFSFQIHYFYLHFIITFFHIAQVCFNVHILISWGKHIIFHLNALLLVSEEKDVILMQWSLFSKKYNYNFDVSFSIRFTIIVSKFFQMNILLTLWLKFYCNLEIMLYDFYFL